MIQVKTGLISNKRIKENYFRATLKAGAIAKDALPGQFVNIKVGETIEPLLRRPFSIHRIKGSNIEILYEVVGKGTEILSQKESGEYLDIIGPLGNGFDLQIPNPESQAPILAAGGMGVAPLTFLAENLVRSSKFVVHSKPVILLGAKTKKQILCEEEFRKLGCNVEIATDDGSRGFKGKVTDLLRHLVSTIDYRPSTIYACGPRPMLKEITRISQRCDILAQISLEEHMACGIGACLGCVVKTTQGYERVCKEGPVFNADEIIWNGK